MSSGVAPDETGRISWATVRRELDGMAHRVRLELLDERLRELRSLAVAHCTRGWFGDRVTMWLDDGSLMKLKLFWPVSRPLAAVLSVRFDARVGWLVSARTTSGERVVLCAWLARLFPAGSVAR